MHSHAKSTNIITSLFAGKTEFKISHQEMIKGIDGHGYFDELVIPIIENTAWEHELADSLGETIAKYPKSVAVLVRRHGMYVWGKTWEQAKRHGECLHYLFDIAIEMHKLGIDFNSPPIPVPALPSTESFKKRKLELSNGHANLPFKHLLLDIEGTTTPLTFVKDVLFPYSASQAATYLRAHWNESKVQNVLKGLVEQANSDTSSPSALAIPLVPESVPFSEELLTALDAFVKESIAKDRKIAPLKTLQGFIWDHGYHSGELKGALFDEVATVLQKIADKGISISIYSSGSKLAQRLLFSHSVAGDLTPLFTSYFDTAVGSKVGF